VKDFLKLDFEGLSVERTIRIYNAIGQLMDQHITNDMQVELDMSALPAGLFHLQIVSDEGTLNQKLLK
jgi:hypothetical protein